MRITFVVNNYPPRVGGVELHVGNLARHLADGGHEVTVHTLSRDAIGEREEQGVIVHRWREMFTIGGLLGIPSPAAIRGIWGGVRKSDSTVSVHTRFFPLTWLGVAAARSASLPTVLTEHGSDHVASPSPIIRWGSRFVDLTIGRWSLRSANVVLGVSEEVVSFVRRISGVNAAVFHNAIVAPPTRATRALRRHLVFVGRIVAGKGWEDFLEALSGQEQSVTGEILGDGPDMDLLTERVAELGLSERVAVRGRVPMTEVFEALAGSILVNPSRLSEGFQGTLLEAAAVNGRIVTYPVPGAQVLRTEGVPIRIVQPSVADLSEAVRCELDDPGRAWPSERVEAWTWPVRTREYASIVAGVEAGRRTSQK